MEEKKSASKDRLTGNPYAYLEQEFARSVSEENGWSFAREEILTAQRKSYIATSTRLGLNPFEAIENCGCPVCKSWRENMVPADHYSTRAGADDVRSTRKELGLCAECGSKGQFINLACVCPEHGRIF